MTHDIGAHNTRHPPSQHAMDALARAAFRPFPSQEVNFTVRDKLLAFGYAELLYMPSPYKTHRDGREISFLVATAAGRAALANRKRT